MSWSPPCLSSGRRRQPRRAAASAMGHRRGHGSSRRQRLGWSRWGAAAVEGAPWGRRQWARRRRRRRRWGPRSRPGPAALSVTQNGTRGNTTMGSRPARAVPLCRRGPRGGGPRLLVTAGGRSAARDIRPIGVALILALSTPKWQTMIRPAAGLDPSMRVRDHPSHQQGAKKENVGGGHALCVAPVRFVRKQPDRREERGPDSSRERRGGLPQRGRP